jgi:hypothetical protein
MKLSFDTVSVNNPDEASSLDNAGISDWDQERKLTFLSPKLSQIASIMKMMNDNIAIGPRGRPDNGTSNLDRQQYQKVSVNLNGIDRVASKGDMKKRVFAIQIVQI